MSIEEDKNVVFSFNEQSDEEVDNNEKNVTNNLEVKADASIEHKPSENEYDELVESNQLDADGTIQQGKPDAFINENVADIIKLEVLDQANQVIQHDEVNKEEEVNVETPLKFQILDIIDFKRIEVKRNTRKTKTAAPIKKSFNIEKFTEEITKITEDMEIDEPEEIKPSIFEAIEEKIPRKNEKKKTIRFHNKKTTFQYPKELELNIGSEGLGPDVDIETMPAHSNYIINEEEAN